MRNTTFNVDFGNKLKYLNVDNWINIYNSEEHEKNALRQLPDFFKDKDLGNLIHLRLKNYGHKIDSCLSF